MSRIKNWIGAASVCAGVSLVGCGGTQPATDMSAGGYNSRPMDSTNSIPSSTSMSAATLGSRLLPVQGKQTFLTGVNVDSFSGQPNLEFGKSPTSPNADPSYNPKVVNSALQDISGFGCNTVRVVVFNKLNGLKLDSNGVVTGLDETFVKNIQDLVSKAEANKVQLYLCLTGSWIGQTAAKNPITDTGARTALLKNAITPLMGKLRGRSGVLAIDVIDEIESDVVGKDANSSSKGATWDQARSYIKAVTDVIKSVDPNRLVTASSGSHDFQNIRAGKFAKLGLDFYDFHTYDDLGLLPPVKDLHVDRPVVIGNCGQKTTKTDNDLQAKTDVAFLTSALKEGYAGALISDYSKDTQNALSLLDKDGKHKPVVAQVQTFVANIPMLAASATAPSK